MPRSSYGYKVKIYPWLVLLFLFFWLIFTIYCVFISARFIDYGITKADNKVMKTKFALIAEEVANNRKYLKMARDTDLQMRKMLGMQAGKHINLPAGIEQGQEERGLNFRDIFTSKGDNLNEEQMLSYLKETLPESAYVSVMAQYTPVGEIEAFPELQRPLTAREYRTVCDHLQTLSFSRLFLQSNIFGDR